MEEFLERVPVPEVDAGKYLADILFTVGPVKGESYLCEGDLEPWERRRGVELAPWQAELIVDLSKAFLMEMHRAKESSAICPWPLGQNAWRMAQDRKFQAARQKEAETEAQETPANGRSKRHRNPSPR